MITIYVIFIILFFLILGFVQIILRLSKLKKNIDFSLEYLDNFTEFANNYQKTGGINGEKYVWLTLNVSKIQKLLGNYGKFSYQPSYQNYIIQNYQLILNTIPKFKSDNIHYNDMLAVEDCLLRYVGSAQENQNKLINEIRNPVIWFRTGVSSILFTPFLFLQWFGVISNSKAHSIGKSLIYRFLTGLIALATFISAIVTIIVGYDSALSLLKKIL